MKRLMALFLAVIMVCTLVPATVFAASAKLIIAETAGQAAKEIDMSASASGSGWSWNASKKTLTLSGFNGESISAGSDMTVILKGKNTITLAKKAEFGIKVDGKLTIEKSSSSASDTLTIVQKTTASSSNLIMTGGVGESTACVINGGTVTLTNSTTGGNGSGIGYQAYVNNDASLIISVPYRGVASKLTANTTGKIDITTTGNNAFSAAAYALDAKGKGTVTLRARSPAVTVFDSLNIADTAGTVTLDGFTKVSSEPLKYFTVGYNKKLSNAESYYNGYYTSDAAGNTGYYLTDSQGNPLSTATYTTLESQKLVVMDSPLFDLNELRVGTPVDTGVGLLNATRGGEGNYRYALKSGSSLPTGLSLSSTTGAISGTPSKACEAGSFTVVCSDKKGGSGCSTAEVVIKYSAVKASDEYITVGDYGKFNMNTDLAAQDYSWKYTAKTKTLELKLYNNGPIIADSDLIIKLSDSNTITLPGTAEAGIRVNGKLTIESTEASVTDTLTIRQTTTSTSANLIVTGGTGESKACIINGGNIVLDCSSSARSGVGIQNWAYVNNDAMLSIKAGYRGVDTKLFANSSAVITIATLGLSEGAAAVNAIEANGTGIVTLSAPASASTVNESLKVASGAGTVILAGYTRIAEKAYQNYSIAPNKQLLDNDSHPIDGYYLGYSALGTAGQGLYITDSYGTIIPGCQIATQDYQPLTVMKSTLFNIPSGDVGVKIDTGVYLLNATRGGDGYYVYTLKDGSSLPAGLTLNSSTGGISGIPTAPCDPGTFTVTVKDRGGASGCSRADVTFTYGKISVSELGKPNPSSGNKASTGQVTLTWKTVPGAEKYEIYRATSKSGTYTRMTTTTKTTYTNTTSKPGITYYYKVKAVGYDGSKTVSPIVSRTCDCARPDVKLSCVSSTGKIKVSWDKIDGAQKYEVYRATSVGGTYKLLITTTKTSITNTSATAGKKYYYKVKALSSKTAAADSAYSEIVYRYCDCAKPVVKVSNVSSSGKIKLTWEKVAGATKYEVWRATKSGGTYTRLTTTTSTSFTNTSATAGKKYYYKVKAIASNSSANSAYSSVVSRVCDCGKPVVTITLSSKKPKLSWKAISGATSYEIYRSSSKNGTYTKIATTTKTSFTNTSTKSGYSYFYKVRAISKLSTSAKSVYSSIVSITSK